MWYTYKKLLCVDNHFPQHRLSVHHSSHTASPPVDTSTSLSTSGRSTLSSFPSSSSFSAKAHTVKATEAEVRLLPPLLKDQAWGVHAQEAFMLFCLALGEWCLWQWPPHNQWLDVKRSPESHQVSFLFFSSLHSACTRSAMKLTHCLFPVHNWSYCKTQTSGWCVT